MCDVFRSRGMKYCSIYICVCVCVCVCVWMQNLMSSTVRNTPLKIWSWHFMWLTS